MLEFGLAFVVFVVVTVAFSRTLRRYHGPERSLLQLSLALHLAFGAIHVPLLRGPLGGGDLLYYDVVARAMLDRLPRDPADTLGQFWALLLHSADPLSIPDAAIAHGGSGSMVTFTALGLILTLGSLPAACVLVAGFSFYGKLCMYDVFRADLEPSLHRRVLAAVLLVPSAVFWSSGLIKEAFATIGLGLVFRELHNVYHRRSAIRSLIPGTIGVCLIATIKPYVLIPVGVAAAASVLFATGSPLRARRRSLTFVQRTAMLAIGAMAVFSAGAISSEYDPMNVVETTERQQEIGAQTTAGGSYYTLGTQRSLAGQLLTAPLALGTALFRPFIFEARNAQSAANGLETLFFTFLFARAVRHGRAAYQLIRREPILIFCAVFASTMGVGTGLASTNLGTLSRYRMPMMPFLWVVVTVVAAMRRSALPVPGVTPNGNVWASKPAVPPKPALARQVGPAAR